MFLLMKLEQTFLVNDQICFAVFWGPLKIYNYQLDISWPETFVCIQDSTRFFFNRIMISYLMVEDIPSPTNRPWVA